MISVGLFIGTITISSAYILNDMFYKTLITRAWFYVKYKLVGFLMIYILLMFPILSISSFEILDTFNTNSSEEIVKLIFAFTLTYIIYASLIWTFTMVLEQSIFGTNFLNSLSFTFTRLTKPKCKSRYHFHTTILRLVISTSIL